MDVLNNHTVQNHRDTFTIACLVDMTFTTHLLNYSLHEEVYYQPVFQNWFNKNDDKTEIPLRPENASSEVFSFYYPLRKSCIPPKGFL